MGSTTKGFKKNILNGNWDIVRSMLRRRSVQRRIHEKRYQYTFKYRHTNGRTYHHDESVTALHLLVTRPNVPIDILQKVLQIRIHDDNDRNDDRNDSDDDYHNDTPLSSVTSYPNGELPLHYVMRNRKSNEEMIRVVASDSSNPNGIFLTTNLSGDTPLHVACDAKRSIKSIVALLEHIDDPSSVINLVNNEGNTPLQLIENKKKKNILLLLLPWEYIYLRNIRRLFAKYTAATEAAAAPSTTDVSTVTAAMQDDQNGGGDDDDGISPTPPTTNRSIDTSDGGNVSAPQPPPPEAAIDSGGDGGLCIVCWEKEADHALIPCGHMCLCIDCATTTTTTNTGGRRRSNGNRRDYNPPHQRDAGHGSNNSNSKNGKCPICNKRFMDCIKIYRSGVVMNTNNDNVNVDDSTNDGNDNENQEEIEEDKSQ